VFLSCCIKDELMQHEKMNTGEYFIKGWSKTLQDRATPGTMLPIPALEMQMG